MPLPATVEWTALRLFAVASNDSVGGPARYNPRFQLGRANLVRPPDRAEVAPDADPCARAGIGAAQSYVVTTGSGTCGLRRLYLLWEIYTPYHSFNRPPKLLS